MSTGRTGRRPGPSNTRESILTAARSRFAEVGFDAASIKSIAGLAAVDPALVHHYFGTKRELFVEAVALPVDPAVALAPLADAPLESMGEALLRTVVGIWDSPAGAGVLAAFRAIIAGGDESLLRTFLLDVALKGVRERLDDDAETRIALVAAQMVGLLVTRKILLIEPVASMSIDDLAAVAAPTLQHYLTGPLDSA
ncbi:MAG: TetR family transcriptional regulator [Gordonia sp. (in: high G+C Gram-positive bacteria)]|uniref:TetR/AcrR family transcriptional regulator n=1 Tax=Gordonia sp. (in: high G+C Gram-positive bacteria) TaxID=84139 RepID=UPI003BB58CC8